MPPAEFAFQPGDLAACYGSDAASRLISLGTSSLLAPAGLRWAPSHVAILCTHGDERLWVESTTLAPRPCRLQQRCVSGVQAHLPAARIADYCQTGGRVDLYRLVAIESLSRDEDRLLTRILLVHFIGNSLPYDLAGALLSGTRLFQRSRLFPRADLRQLFCSELAAAVLMRLGRLGRDNPTRFHPARLLRTLVRHGTYRRVATWRGPAA